MALDAKVSARFYSKASDWCLRYAAFDGKTGRLVTGRHLRRQNRHGAQREWVKSLVLDKQGIPSSPITRAGRRKVQDLLMEVEKRDR